MSVPSRQLAPGVARVWPVLLLAGLFVPMPKMASAGRPALDLTYSPTGKEGLRYQFMGPQALDMGDQTALLAVLLEAQTNLAAGKAELQDASVASDTAQLVDDINAVTSNDARDAESSLSFMFRTSWASLCRRLGGGTGGSALAQRREQLTRLASLRVQVGRDDQGAPAPSAGETLLSFREAGRGQLSVTLGAWLTSAVRGERYARIDFAERQALPSDIARAAHAFFCGVLGTRRSLPIGLETLCRRIWPEHDKAPEATRRRRRSDVRAALAAIEHLQGWQVMTRRGDVFEVTRSEHGDAKGRNASANAKPKRPVAAVSSLVDEALPSLSPEAFSALFAELALDAAIAR